jgi:hypothetical protein
MGSKKASTVRANRIDPLKSMRASLLLEVLRMLVALLEASDEDPSGRGDEGADEEGEEDVDELGR